MTQRTHRIDRRLLETALVVLALSAPCVLRAAECGDGLLAAGETCESCPADCNVEPCTPGTGEAAFDVTLTAPPAKQPSAVTLRLAYRSRALGLPGTGTDPSVRQRFVAESNPPILIANDLGHAVRVVIAKGGGFGTKKLLAVRFDRCSGAPDPTAADLACTVEGCSDTAGAIGGCTCEVRAAAR